MPKLKISGKNLTLDGKVVEGVKSYRLIGANPREPTHLILILGDIDTDLDVQLDDVKVTRSVEQGTAP